MNPEDKPEFWLLMMLEALVGLRCGNQEPATKYLQFVERKRGRAEALGARGRLNQYKNMGAFPKAIEKINSLKGKK